MEDRATPQPNSTLITSPEQIQLSIVQDKISDVEDQATSQLRSILIKESKAMIPLVV